MTDVTGTPSFASRRLGAIRITVGFVQGLALWLLTEAADHKVWPASEPAVFGALAMVAMFAPFVVLGGLSSLRPRTLAVWGVFAAAVLAALGLHDLIRRGAVPPGDLWVSPQLIAFAAAGLFIAHHLVEGGDGERKLIARYVRYFDIAWKHGVQIVLSAGFVGVFWIVLLLGGSLFNLIGIKFVSELIEKPWFFLPATATMFAAAVHLTDVRAGLIKGIRTVALTLLSWLLPVLVVLATAFLLALPFTGLDPLWKTRSAAGILLSAAATLIILINAAYQDGEPDGVVPLVLRVAGRTGGMLLVPLVAIAIYALWLRIGQHGLTPDRIVAAACALVATVYALGYAFASLRLGRWMLRLEITNVTAAFLSLAVLLSLFSPLADPARLSVDAQMARLAAGKVTPEAFDYKFLRFEGQRYGRKALESLKGRGGEAGRRAGEALAMAESGRWSEPDTPRTVPVAAIDVWPKGRTLPASFLEMDWSNQQGDRARCADVDQQRCSATFLDLDGDGREEIAIAQYGRLYVYAATPEGKWSSIGFYAVSDCGKQETLTNAVRAGTLKTLTPLWRDIDIAGRRFGIAPSDNGCINVPASQAIPDPDLQATRP